MTMVYDSAEPPKDPREGDIWIPMSQDVAPPGFCAANTDVPLFSREWMRRLRCDPRTHPSQLTIADAYRDAQLVWLRATLVAEGAPTWLIDEALERW